MNKWIVYWANRYSWALKHRPDIDIEDLLQAAWMGAYIAQARYNPDKGKFSTFSAFYIQKELRDLIGVKNGELPPATESLDEVLQDGKTSILDMLEDESIPDNDEALHEKEQRQGIRAAILRLPDQLREIMTLFYLQGMGAREIGQKLGYTELKVIHLAARGRRVLKRDKLIQELGRIEFPNYLHVGVGQFNSTNTSAVEKAFFIREEQRERIHQKITALKEQDAQEDVCE